MTALDSAQLCAASHQQAFAIASAVAGWSLFLAAFLMWRNEKTNRMVYQAEADSLRFVHDDSGYLGDCIARAVTA